MTLLYTFSIVLIRVGFAIASVFHPKARLWHKGQRGLLRKVAHEYRPASRTLWIHAASVGEFEQGRPLIEELRKQCPNYQVVLTFFSPSGYELRKNYPGADYVYYLPADFPRNARRFVELIQPTLVVFVKYEFWYHHLHELHRRQIPTYLISAIFRRDQAFFKAWGGWYRGVLRFFTRIFVQDENSLDLLKAISIRHTQLAGDTRFDRVVEITAARKEVPLAHAFVANRKMWVLGSTWAPDEELWANYLSTNTHADWCYMLVPHEIGESHLKAIESQFAHRKLVRFSQAQTATVAQYDVLLVDTIGLLSSLYAYGHAAYIGGGFGSGIHNTLEAATYALPVVFGPRNQKFKEATDLISHGAAYSVSNAEEFALTVSELSSKPDQRRQSGSQAAAYVLQNTGATKTIMEAIQCGAGFE